MDSLLTISFILGRNNYHETDMRSMWHVIKIVSSLVNYAKKTSALRVAYRGGRGRNEPDIKRLDSLNMKKGIVEDIHRTSSNAELSFCFSDDETFEEHPARYSFHRREDAIVRLKQDLCTDQIVTKITGEDQKMGLCPVCGDSFMSEHGCTSVHVNPGGKEYCNHMIHTACIAQRVRYVNYKCPVCLEELKMCPASKMPTSETMDLLKLIDKHGGGKKQSVGLPQNVLQDNICALCGERVQDCKIDDCRHMFCRECIGGWLNKSTTRKICRPGSSDSNQATCPTCRNDISSITYTHPKTGRIEEPSVPVDVRRERFYPEPSLPDSTWRCIPIETGRRGERQVIRKNKSNWGEQTCPPPTTGTGKEPTKREKRQV